MTSLATKLLGPPEKVELFPSLPTHLLRWMISVHNIWKAINNDAKRTPVFQNSVLRVLVLPCLRSWAGTAAHVPLKTLRSVRTVENLLLMTRLGPHSWS